MGTDSSKTLRVADSGSLERGSLVLLVKEGESLLIGEAEIQVVAVGGHSAGRAARVRVLAPKSIKVTKIKGKAK